MNYCVNMVKVILVCLALFANPYKSSAYDLYSKDGWKVMQSDNSILKLSYKPVILRYDTIQSSSGLKTIFPKISGAYAVGEPGTPMKMMYTVNITVPSPDGIANMSYTLSKPITVEGKITPNPDFRNQSTGNDNPYRIDDVSYSSLSDRTPVQIEYAGIMRNRHIERLNVVAAEYRNGQIIIPGEIIITIKFNAGKDKQAMYKPDDMDIPVSINHFESKLWIINNSKMNDDKNRVDMTQAVDDIPWIKIKVDKEGIYQITPSILAGLGYTIPKEEISTIKIYGNGGMELSERVSDAVKNGLNEQDIIVKTNTSGNLEKIEFYGSPASGFKYDNSKGFKHYINHYSDYNYYILTWKGTNGKRAVPQISPAGEVLNRPNTYLNLLFYEEEMHNAFQGGSGRQWLGRNLLPATFFENLTNLDRTGRINYRVSFAHRASTTGYYTVKENNKEIISGSLSSNGGYVDGSRKTSSSTFSATNIAGDNKSILQFDYKNSVGGSGAEGYFDWYEIQYPSYFIPVDNQIGFFTEPSSTGLTEYSINNFSGQEILGFDVSNPAQPKQIENNSNTGGIFAFKNLPELKNPKRFFISSNIKTPVLEKAEFGNLRNINANADIILITNQQLLESAEAYKEYREKQNGMKVAIVRTDHIFNEFGSGIQDPTAIRDFIAYSFDNWTTKPRFVLLWGDGHYDYKQIATKVTNFVPTWQTEDDTDSFYEINSYTSDDFFANIAGDDALMDIAIGRLPVYSNESGMTVLDKIKHYENGSSKDPWRTKMTIIADDSWRSKGTDGTLHTGQAEELWANSIPDEIQVDKLYLPEYPSENVTGGKRKPKVMEEIISNVNTGGNLLMTYIGHGNPRVWAHEEVFERSITIPQLKNPDKLFFVTVASCDFGRFDDPETRSGAEELILSRVGGAIGTYSSVRLVFAEQNSQLNELLFSNIFNRNPETGEHYRIGEVSMFSKMIKFDTNDQKFCLLGDPTIKLLYPDYQTFIDTINSYNVAGGDTAYVQALSKVKITGRVTEPSSTITDASFNGTVLLSMLDSDKYLTVLEDDGNEGGTTHRYYKNGGALNRSSYEVVNGHFTAEFFIPKDISFSGKTGRLYAYAYSNDDRFANGDTRNFIISGIDSSSNSDTEGPEIQAYLDSRDFLPGEYVRCTPLLIVDLKDESGINTTGLGLGHRIEAWIDDSPNSIDLSEKFQSSVGNSGSGSVEEFLFDLKPGLHKVKVRAWDVFNNFSTDETYFRTGDCDGIIISNLLNYPNPAPNSTGETLIKFNHNISPPFNAELNVMNILGQDVYNNNYQITTNHTGEIYWNCKDADGNLVPQGNYLYIINIETIDGLRKSDNNVMTIIR